MWIKMTLKDALLQNIYSGIYPFHMPGHKRNPLFDISLDPALDVTETDGTDNLHNAKGILEEGMKRAASLYGSADTFYLVNGSTCGILAGISALSARGDKILMARNCHISVYNAVRLNGLEPVYLMPPKSDADINGSITPDAVEKALAENPGIRLAAITSPTYEGVVSDIKSIAEILHRQGVPLLVDEAHGAHFGFSSGFPESSVRRGADIVIHSVHKTLPCPTQTALIHVNGALADKERVKQQLAVYETSSPSYVFMAAIDSCVELLKEKKEMLFSAYKARLGAFYEKAAELKNLKIIKSSPLFFDFDIGKIVISTKNTGITGLMLKNILLSEYKLQLEMAYGTYALAMTSIADTDEGFDRLISALIETDGAVKPAGTGSITAAHPGPDIVLRPHEAESSPCRFIPYEDCAGHISGEYVYAYPPGIPALVPGEKITKPLKDYMDSLLRQGTELVSTNKKLPGEIKVVNIT